MKQLNCTLLSPTGSLPPLLKTTSFLTLRSFRKFAMYRNPKVIFCSCSLNANDKIFLKPSRLVDRKRRVSTDGPKKSQFLPAQEVCPLLPHPNQVSSYVATQSLKMNNAQDSTCLPFNFPAKSQEFESYSETGANVQPFPFDPLVVLESAYLPSFHSCNEELLRLFQFSDKQDSVCQPEGVCKSSREIQQTTIAERRVEKRSYLPRHQEPFTFESVHRFEDSEVDKDSLGKTDIIDPPNLPNMPSGPLIIPTGRSSLIINKDLYITNRILEKIKDKEGKEQSEESVKVPEPTVKASVPENTMFQVDNQKHSSSCKSELHCSASSSDPQPKTASPSSEPNLLSNAEFQRLPEDNNFTFAEAQSLESRKKFYEMLSSAPPCCLIDGLHVEHVTEVDAVEEEPLASNTLPEDLQLKLVDSVIKQLDEWASQGELDVVESENLPIDKEIESIVLAIIEPINFSDRSFDSDTISVSEIFPEVLKDADSNITNTLEPSSFEPVESFESIMKPPNELNIPKGSNSGSNFSSSSQKVPPRKTNSNIDIKIETTIKCSRSGDKTNIDVVEVQKYLDKRLPYPFSTETILQVVGSNDSLRPATQTIENSKAQLVHLSNANSSNPGMLIPKLQFNHMLSKSHDYGKVGSNDKKQSLKINVIPNSSIAPDPTVAISLTNPSDSLQIPKLINAKDSAARELTKKSKVLFKGSKKGRRRESVTFRPQKLVGDKVGENIKILSPRDLDKMFPAPPKPKVVETPRSVTVNTKAANEPTRVWELPAARVSSAPIALQPKIESPPPEDKIVESLPLAVVKENAISAEVSKAKMYNLMKRDQVESRNESDLKSIISNKVKDSFLTVSNREPAERSTKFEKTEDSLSPALKLKTNVHPREEKPKNAKKEAPKTIRAGDKSSSQPHHPTPHEKREYISISDSPKESAKLPSKSPVFKLDKSKEAEVIKADKKLKDETVLPLSAKEAIANVMKNAGDSYSPEYRRIDPPLENPYKVKPGKEVIESPVVQSKPDQSKRFSRPPKHNFHSVYDDLQSAKDVKKSARESPKDNANTQASTSTAPNVPRTPNQPLFFPYETPIVKESIATPPPDFKSFDSPYSVDFCKECKEMKPSLECFSPLQCKVPLKKIKKFPMINESKGNEYNVPQEGAISISHNTNVMLKKTLASVPAVTKILGATLSATSQKALDRWKQGLLSTLGEEGFKEFYEKQLKQGSDFHSLVGKYLLGPRGVERSDDPCIKSLSYVFPHITDVGVVESQVVHPQLGYWGVVDCVAKYKGKPVVIEWKRSEKAKPTLERTYDAPLQLSAYLGAMNYDNNYGLQVKGGLVVVAHSDGSPADVFELTLEDCNYYWVRWLKRLHRYFVQPQETLKKVK